MAKRCFEVWWSPSSYALLQEDDSQWAGVVLAIVRARAGNLLPSTNPEGKPIAYALYHSHSNGRETVPILKSRTIAQNGIVNGSRLYLSDPNHHWWAGCVVGVGGKNTIRYTPPLSPDGGNDKTLVVSPVVEKTVVVPSYPNQPPHRPQPSYPNQQPSYPNQPPPARQAIANCRVHLARGCTVSVPKEGITLNRTYLIEHLPRSVVTAEEAKKFVGITSRLSRVSRRDHCRLFCQQGVWILTATEATYINGRTMKGGTSVSISQSTTIILGNNGWPVDIELSGP